MNQIAEWQHKTQQNAMRVAFQLIGEAADHLVDGKVHALFVSGPPGVGKNFVFDQVFRRRGVTVHEASPTSKLGFMDAVHEAGTGVLLLNETDHLWRAEIINEIKKATDTNPSLRTLVNNRLAKRTKDPAYHSGEPLRVRCRFVFLSNKDLNDDTQWSPGVRPHLDAIRSRLEIYPIPHDLSAMFNYTCYLAICHGLFRKERYGLDTANKALAYLAQTMWVTNDASPRRVLKIAAVIHRHRDNWRDVLNARLPLGAATGVGPGHPVPVPPTIIPPVRSAPPVLTAPPPPVRQKAA